MRDDDDQRRNLSDFGREKQNEAALIARAGEPIPSIDERSRPRFNELRIYCEFPRLSAQRN